MPRLHVIVQRYVPRWAIEVALVAAAVQIYRQTMELRSRVLDHPIMVRVERCLRLLRIGLTTGAVLLPCCSQLAIAKAMPATRRARGIGYSVLTLAVTQHVLWPTCFSSPQYLSATDHRARVLLLQARSDWISTVSAAAGISHCCMEVACAAQAAAAERRCDGSRA